MEKKIKRWELTGILFITLFGASLHFLFEWTGYWRPIAVIAAVNESTWEHFKIAFWPSFFWMIIERLALQDNLKNFWAAKAAGMASMPVVIAALFYGYSAITGEHMLILDIIIFILAVITDQLISYRILLGEEIRSASLRKIAILVLAVMALKFSLLSYLPGKNFLFAHPGTGEYGILSEYEHKDH